MPEAGGVNEPLTKPDPGAQSVAGYAFSLEVIRAVFAELREHLTVRRQPTSPTGIDWLDEMMQGNANADPD